MGREKLHRLIEELPEQEVQPAERFLEYLRNVGSDPVARAFMEAPVDDEPLTPEDERAIREAEDEIARGEGIPWEEARQLLGGARKASG
ncbi:MAG: hypothetical protein KGJ86_08900 [Chloroflexota bacterium]|nr:hypothetical protein [Chloroflexota bacterium]